MTTAKELLKHDSRLTEKLLLEGVLTKDDLQKHLQALPDLTNSCLKVEVEEPSRLYDSDETDADNEEESLPGS